MFRHKTEPTKLRQFLAGFGRSTVVSELNLQACPVTPEQIWPVSSFCTLRGGNVQNEDPAGFFTDWISQS